MKGTAPAGVTAADMESRIVQPDDEFKTIIGRRDVRAPGAELDNATQQSGTLEFAPGAEPGTQVWTATHTFTNPGDPASR